MKKLAFLLASAGLLLTACIAEDSQMTEPIQEAVIISASYDAPDSEPGTKSTLDGNGAFEWTEGDAFIALNDNGYWYDFTKTDTEYADKYKANFIGFDVPGGSVTFPAVFPARAFSDASGEGATLKPDFTPNDGILRVYFPNTIAWTEGQVNNYMVSNFYRDNANNIQFLNMAGMLKFEFNNVPVNATKFAVSIYGAKIANTADDKSDVSTWFSVDSLNLNYDDDNHPTTFAKKIGEDDFSTVTFTFDKVVTAGKSMTFYLPVPQMDLNNVASLSVPYNKVKIQFLDAQDNVLESFTSSKKNRYIRRKQIKTFPSITFMTGGAETKVVEEVNPTDPEYNQTFTLPKTSNDVIVKVYKTTGTITLGYASDATSDEKPSNVTVRMVSDGDQTEDVIEALNIQLPASHVTIETDSENDKIKVKDVTAVTSNSTLVVKSGVKVESLTVAQGNAEVAGNVSAVKVEANKTQGSTPILVSVSKTAAVKTITLETVATVTVEQPEGNIVESDTQNKVNVIVESGASGSTATAQNGGDIYVTANAAVDIDAGGTGSTITVDPKSETPGEITPSYEDGGEIIFGKAAKIGEVEYDTLPNAFAAVADGQTIVLLANVALTDRLFVNAGATPSYGGDNNRYATTTENKEVTLDLNGFNINTSSNIALAGGTLNILNNGATASAITSSNSGLAPVEVRGTGSLSAKRTLTIGQKVTLYGLEYGLNIFGSNNDKQNFIEVIIDGTVNGTLFVLGNLKNTSNDIDINVNGTINVTENNDNKANVGIALNGYATVNVASTANVSGESGIEVRAGELTVENDAAITANASSSSYAPNGSGSTTRGAAVAVVQHTTILPINATFNGGTLNGIKNLYVRDEMENNLANVFVTATGAIKEEAEVDFEGYNWFNNGDGTYKLVATTWNGNSMAPLTVVDANTYAIYSAPQLAQLAYDVNHNANGNYAGKTVVLMNDIDLKHKEWTPIGLGGTSADDDKGSETGCFLGTFDGNHKTINNLYVSQHNDDRSFAGLFGNITLTSSTTVTIKDVAVNNVNIRSNHMAAGILGRYYGKNNAHLVISDCSVSNGLVVSTAFLNSQNVYESGNQAAGIVGNAYGKGITITNCEVSQLNIYATRDIAGIAGMLEAGGVTSFTGNSVTSVSIIRLIQDGYEKQEGDSALSTLGEIVGRGGYSPDNTNTASEVTIRAIEYDPNTDLIIAWSSQQFEEEEGEW